MVLRVQERRSRLVSGLALNAVQVQDEALAGRVGDLLACQSAAGEPACVLHVQVDQRQVVPALLAAIGRRTGRVAEVRRQLDRGGHGTETVAHGAKNCHTHVRVWRMAARH